METIKDVLYSKLVSNLDGMTVSVHVWKKSAETAPLATLGYP